MAQTMTKQQRPSGWWYPYIFVGGFLVVLSVNVALLFFATTTFNGLESRTAYQEGLAYNQAIAEEEKQKALGWTVAASVQPAPSADAPHRALVQLTAQDRDGKPLEGLTVEVTVRRPTVEGYDQHLLLTEISPGLYGQGTDLGMAGQWEVRAVATRGDDTYRLRDRFILR